MKSVLKKIVAAATGAVFTMACVPAFAEEVVIENTEETVVENAEVLELTVEEAIKLAKENNPLIEANDAAIRSAELSVEVAKESVKDYSDMEKAAVSMGLGKVVAINVSSGLEQAYLKHGYYADAAQVGYELAVMEKDKTLSSIAYDVTQKYYSVKLMEQLVEISETGLAIARENADVVKKSYELGYVSQLEVKNVENSVKSAEFSLESNMRNKAIATENLKIALGIDLSGQDIVLTDEISVPELPQNSEEKIEGAMTTRYDVTALLKSSELSKRYFDITSAYMSKNTAAYNSAYSEYLSSKYAYENSAKLIRLSLQNDYAAMLTARDSVDTALGSLEVKQIEYESAKIKYEMGLITNLELTSVMAELDSSKVQYENAKTEYLLAVLKFNYNTEIGI